MVQPSASRKAAHPRALHKTSEFILLVYCGTVLALHRYAPIKISPLQRMHPTLRIGVGWLLGILGAALIVWLRLEMKRYAQPTQPGKPTTRLITTGPFRYSRNPTYLSFVALVVPGIGLLCPNNGYIWIVWPVLVLAFYGVMIKDEEEYLNEVFGIEWRNYCHQTRRWV